MITFGKNVRVWAIVYALAGGATCVLNLWHVSAPDLRRFLLYLVCANVAALCLRWASTRTLFPAGLLILLLGIEELSLPELLFIAFTVTLLRDVRFVRRVSEMAPLFYSISSVTIGLAAAHGAYQLTSLLKFNAVFPAPAIASSFVLLFNCGLATALLQDRSVPFTGVYRRECRPLLPWFVAAAYLAYLVRCTSLHTGYHAGLIALPILFALDHGYRAWAAAKSAHREELEALHRHTLETLAVAIDTRDRTNHLHLRRVQTYAMAVGRELGLSKAELQSLNIAALLHDIGKLGIPDHILLKPGPLTDEEWEKMKTHPMMGAEMLSRMNYPAPVLSIVKAHHEKWNGTGYPIGLAGEEIPIGARILSAVDGLDALGSDRPYRKALPLREAMNGIRAEAGKSYDPLIVAILERRHVELEQAAAEANGGSMTEDDAHTARSEESRRHIERLEAASGATSILDPISSARQETQVLQSLAGGLAQSLRPDEVAASLEECLRRLLRYDTFVLYVRHSDTLEPICIRGEHGHLFSHARLPLKQSLSGRVAQSGIPELNGDIRLEPNYSNDSPIIHKLRSALAVPFEGRKGLTGVLTLYRPDVNGFTRDNLRVVQAACLKAGPALESALRYQDAEESAVTDHLTGVANARSLAMHLERELARAGRENSTVGILVCDLDGFKQVNDRFGHLKGNEVLQRVAKGVQEVCRASDYLARVGGDEFVVVLPGLGGDLCDSYVRRLAAVAQEVGWQVCGEECLSMSVGAAVYPVDGRDADTLFEEADRRMYRVKQQGKGILVEFPAASAEEPGRLGMSCEAVGE